MTRVIQCSMAVPLVIAALTAWAPSVVGQEQDVPSALPPFHDQLAPAGTWNHTEEAGWTWTPHAVPFNWRPYSQGRWQFAETHGWVWTSSWDWGAIPFHYGRWHFDNKQGWSWTPDTTWAPAWVAWRRGEGYVGWAPLPPSAKWDASAGLGPAAGADIAPDAWTFVEETAFLAPRSVVFTPSIDELLERTSDVTRYTTVDGRVANRSLSREDVEQFTRSVVHPVRIAMVEAAVVPAEPPVESDEDIEPAVEEEAEPAAPEVIVVVPVPSELERQLVPLRFRSTTVVHSGRKWSLHDDQPWSYRHRRSWQYRPPNRDGYEPKRDWTYTPAQRRPYLTRQDWTYHPR
jgi:hypothetical protein